MAENALRDKTDATLLAKGEQASAAIAAAGDPGYELTAAQTTALTSANTAMGTAITSKQAARDASKASTQQALTARDQIIDALASIGASIYNNPNVSEQMIADAGYAVHDDVPTKHAPVQPTKLLADPDASGTVKLSWNGSGNYYPTTYVVEGSADGVTWTLQGTATAQKITLTGFTPGATFRFRVSATRNGQSSVPSATAVIWDSSSESSASLKLAA